MNKPLFLFFLMAWVSGYSQTMTLTSISPSTGAFGNSVTLSGTNLGNTINVFFGTAASVIQSVSSTVVITTAPNLSSGSYCVYASTGRIKSNCLNFTYGLTATPTITPTITPTPTGSWTPMFTSTPTIVTQAPVLGPGSSSQGIHTWTGISVKEAPYYAIGNGSADDTAAIQAAINAAHANGTYKVLIPPGCTCGISAPLTFQNDTVLFSYDRTGGIIHLPGVLHGMIYANAVTNCYVDGLVIDGNLANVTSASNRESRIVSMSVTNCTGFWLKNCDVKNQRGQAVQTNGCSRVHIIDNDIHDCDNWGVVSENVTDCWYQNNHLKNLYILGLYADGQGGPSTRIHISHNTAVNVQNDTNYSGSGIGFSIQADGSPNNETYDVVVDGNIAEFNGSMGFSLTGTNNVSSQTTNGNVVVSGNLSEGQTLVNGFGFELIGDNISMNGNIAKNNLVNVILGEQNCNHIIINGNKFFNPVNGNNVHVQVAASSVSFSMTDLSITGNSFDGGLSGIQVTTTAPATVDSNFSITGNNFYNVGRCVLFQSPVSDCIISGNNYNGGSSTLQRGFDFIGQSPFDLIGNVITGVNVDNGFVVRGNSTGVAIRNNHQNMGTTGIQAVATPISDLNISGNDFNGVTNPTTLTGPTTVTDGGGNSFNYATAAPSSGYWNVGQIVYNTVPTVSGIDSWICTTAGAPGTWVQRFTEQSTPGVSSYTVTINNNSATPTPVIYLYGNNGRLISHTP